MCMNKKAFKDFETKTGIHFTTDHSGKMEGMISLSTSCLCNEYCAQRRKNNKMICAYCYAAAMAEDYSGLRAAIEKNTAILTKEIIPVECWPDLKAAGHDCARLEAFGDIQNTAQEENYFNECEKNPAVRITQWTKNPWIIQQLVNSGRKKPENLIIVYSDPYVDNTRSLDWIFEKFPIIDKIFRVVTKAFAKLHNITINCGARSCITCQTCYRKDSARVIYELLKTGGQTKEELIEKILFAGGKTTAKYIYRVIRTDAHTVICRIPKALKNITDADAILSYRYHTV